MTETKKTRLTVEQKIIGRLSSRLALVSVLLISAVLLFCAGQCWARGWIKDPARLHAGAHGRLSCSDCHDASPGRGHPDPLRINQIPRRGVTPERCYECHSEIEEALSLGKHGGRVVKSRRRFQRCASCHDPHYGYHRGGQPGKFASGLPRGKQCGACHQEKKALPGPSSGDEACWKCHVSAPDGQGVDADKLAGICLDCHGPKDMTAGRAPLLSGGRDDLGPHQELDCTVCHKKAARFPHNRQTLASCLTCHKPHDEKSAGGDAHIRVDCQACHFSGLIPSAVGGRVAGRPAWQTGQPCSIHKPASMDDEKSCKRCHHAGNQAGAADSVLPPKGIACMPCHRASFSLNDWPSGIGLGIFALGLLMAAGVWAGGRRSGPTSQGRGHGPGGFRIKAAIRAFLLDGLLQRRLWRRSPARGLIHSLIFLPFLLRIIYGLVGLLLSLWQPEWQVTQALLYKNHPLTALFFDFTGVMFFAGALLALMRRLRSRGQRLQGMPGPDWIAISLLAGAAALGFALEAVRIAMTGFPAGSGWAFLGWALACAITPGAGGNIYGYLWYAHAVVWAAFMAYLPFSRMLHILAAPVVLAIHGGKGSEHGNLRRTHS